MNINYTMLTRIVLLTGLQTFGVTHAVTTPKVEDDAKSPLGCRDVAYHFQYKVLNLTPDQLDNDGDRQSMFFIFNRLARPVNLYQMRPNDSTRGTYLNHVVRAQQWAVLATGEPTLKYICTVDDAKSSYGKVVDCADTLKVCAFARVKFGMNNRGNYWVVNSNSSAGAVREVGYYGIIPR